MRFSIRSSLTGADIAGSVVVQDCGNNDAITEIVYSTPVALSPSTTYYFIARKTTSDVGTISFYNSGADQGAGHTGYYSTNSGSSWSSSGVNGYTTGHLVTEIETVEGRVYKTSAANDGLGAA